VERHLHAPQEFDEVMELGVATRVAAAADCDTVEVLVHHLEVCERLVGDRPEVFEPLVALTHATGAVVTAFLEGETVPAAESGRTLDVFEVTVPAVKAGPAPEIDGEVRHPGGTFCAPLL